MIRSRREIVMLGLLTSLLAGAALWAWARCATARADCGSAGADLAECNHLADRIKGLQNRPNRAGAETLQLSVLTRRIEQAAAAARIPTNRIDRIWPDQPRRVGETVYKEMPTRMVVKGVDARQLATFLHALARTTPGLWTRSLRLRTPRGQEDGPTWDVEAVVSYLIYDPPSRLDGPARNARNAE